MIFSEIDKNPTKKTVLIAPLDWGLGHAARCMPLINELQKYHLRIIIAAEGPVKTMLKKEFPNIQIIQLSGYRIQYGKNKHWFAFKLFLQLPKIIITIYKEHLWLKKVVKNYSINAVISENRFGLYHNSVTCVYITHQLFIKTGNRFSEIIVSKIHNWVIKKYTQCWVPDFKGQQNIAGALSHPKKMPANVQYIGCLSRFEKKEITQKEFALLIILSGPEPQRTIFENVLLSQLSNFNDKVLFVRGLPDNLEEAILPKIISSKINIVFKNYLTAQQLNVAIPQSALVISRSGYTTIMDLLKLGQKAVLVPTPGQTEQEYLARYLLHQNIFYSIAQQNFLLQDVIVKANNFPFTMPIYNMDLYKETIGQFVKTL